MLGFLKADSGSVRVLGKDPRTDAAALHQKVAYVPGDVELWPNLTGGEAINVFARLRGGVNPKKRDELIERFDFDPLMEVVFQDCILEAEQVGRTVLLSSHILAQVEALADRISIIRNGQNVESGTLTDLRHLSRTEVTVETAHPVEGLSNFDGVHNIEALRQRLLGPVL